jgi:hypothetical protein
VLNGPWFCFKKLADLEIMRLGPNIRVYCMGPGWIDINSWKRKSKGHKIKFTEIDLKQHLVGRVEDQKMLLQWLPI